MPPLIIAVFVLALIAAAVGCSSDDAGSTPEVRPVTEPGATFDIALTQRANCGYRARSHLSVLDPTSGEAQWTVEVPWAGPASLSTTSDDVAPADPTADHAVAVVVGARQSAQPTLAGVAIGPGEPRWQRDLDPPTYPIPSSALVVGPVAITGEADALVAFDPASGEERWRVGIEDFTGLAVGPEQRAVQPGDEAVSEVTLVVHDGDELRRLDPGTGEAVWRTRVSEFPALPPLVADNSVITGGELHALVALDLGTGEHQWEHPPEYDRTFSMVAATDEVLVVADRAGSWPMAAPDDPDDRFTAIDLATGDVAWTADPRAVSAQAQIVGDLLIAPVGSELAAFDVGTGDQRWWIDTGPRQQVWAMGADHLFVSVWNAEDNTSNLWLLDRATGREIWQEGFPLTTTSDALLVADESSGDSPGEGLVVVGGHTHLDDPPPRVHAGGALLGLSLRDGEQRWRAELPEAATTILPRPEGVLVLSSDPGIDC